MKIIVDLKNTERINQNIECQQKAIDRKPLSSYDTQNLFDTKTILYGIKTELSEQRRIEPNGFILSLQRQQHDDEQLIRDMLELINNSTLRGSDILEANTLVIRAKKRLGML